ncbi:Tripartite DNA replication factor [Pseudogymnoascus australis]
MSDWGSSKSDKVAADHRVVITSAAGRNDETGTYDQYHSFDPFGMLYAETKPPEYDDMGIKNPQAQEKPTVPYKGLNVPQPHDKIRVSLSIVSSGEKRGYLAIKVITDTPPTSRPSNEFIAEVRLYGDQVNGATSIIDKSDEDWVERITKAPYIARRTPGWFEKAVKRSDGKHDGKPLPPRQVNQEWIGKNILIFQLHWDTRGELMSQNLFVTCDLPLQPASRAISALQNIFSNSAGFMEIWVRQEKAAFEDSWATLQTSWKMENQQGDIFRRFYSSKIQTSRRMGYIDAGSAIVQPINRPVVTTKKEVVTYNLLELTTRLGVAMIQQSEYEQIVLSKLNASSTAIKLLRVAGAGDRLYTGFLQVGGEDVERRLVEGDKMKVSFRPGDSRQDEEWDAVVVPSHTLGRSGEVILDIFRPRVPIDEDATVEEKKRARPFVGLNLSKYTASPTFESIAEIRSVLNSTPSIVVDIKVQSSKLCMRRVLNGIRNLQHGGKQEQRLDGTQPWVQSDTMEALGRHILMQDTRIWQARTTDFLGNAGREALQHLGEEDHLNAIEYLSKVPTDKHGVSVAVIEGYPGVGKTFFLAETIKALLSASDKSQYLVLAPSNAPADVAAMAIHSTVIKEAIDSGEVIVRAHATSTESSYMHSYALQAHKNEVVRVLSEEDEEEHDDINEEVRRPVEDGPSGFENLDTNSPIDYAIQGDDYAVQGDAEGTPQSVQPALALSNNGFPSKHYTPSYPIPTEDDSDANDATSTDESEPVLATTSARGPDFVTLPADDDIFGKGEAVRLTDEELDSVAKVDVGTYSPGGSINLDLPIAEYLKLSLVGVDLTKAVNRRICPGDNLVKDPRFQVFEQSLGYWALAIAGIIPVKSKHTDKSKWATLATLFHAYVVEGERMNAESQSEFKAQLKLLREFTISTVRVVVTTPVTACSPEFYCNLNPEIIIIDEAGRLNRADYLMVMGHYDTKRFMLLGDRKQLDPVVSGPKALGFSDDLQMSVLTWYHLAWWPSVALYVQRRSWQKLMDVVSQFSYSNHIKDGLQSTDEQKHPYSKPMMTVMGEMFPNFPCKDNPNFYFEVEGDDAIMDEVTKSWLNLKSAAMAINIVKDSMEKGIPAAAFGILTAYGAQVDVCVHALYTLHLANPRLGFDTIPVNTCDDYQGGQKPVIIFLPVVSRRLGFVNDKGRLTIYDIARAKKLVLRVPAKHPMLYNANVVSRAQAVDANIDTTNQWTEGANQAAWDDSESSDGTDASGEAEADACGPLTEATDGALSEFSTTVAENSQEDSASTQDAASPHADATTNEAVTAVKDTAHVLSDSPSIVVATASPHASTTTDAAVTAVKDTAHVLSDSPSIVVATASPHASTTTDAAVTAVKDTAHVLSDSPSIVVATASPHASTTTDAAVTAVKDTAHVLSDSPSIVVATASPHASTTTDEAVTAVKDTAHVLSDSPSIVVATASANSSIANDVLTEDDMKDVDGW